MVMELYQDTACPYERRIAKQYLRSANQYIMNGRIIMAKLNLQFAKEHDASLRPAETYAIEARIKMEETRRNLKKAGDCILLGDQYQTTLHLTEAKKSGLMIEKISEYEQQLEFTEKIKHYYNLAEENVLKRDLENAKQNFEQLEEMLDYAMITDTFSNQITWLKTKYHNLIESERFKHLDCAENKEKAYEELDETQYIDDAETFKAVPKMRLPKNKINQDCNQSEKLKENIGKTDEKVTQKEDISLAKKCEILVEKALEEGHIENAKRIVQIATKLYPDHNFAFPKDLTAKKPVTNTQASNEITPKLIQINTNEQTITVQEAAKRTTKYIATDDAKESAYRNNVISERHQGTDGYVKKLIDYFETIMY